MLWQHSFLFIPSVFAEFRFNMFIFKEVETFYVSRSVQMTGYGLDDWGLIPGKNFSFCHHDEKSSFAVESPIQLVPVAS
jgi:hypothetical protein